MGIVATGGRPAGLSRLAPGGLKALGLADFRWLWLSTVAAFFAFQMHFVGKGWLTYDLTGSPLMLAVVSAAFNLPMALIAPLAGAVADRVNRWRLLVVVQGINTLNTLAFVIVLVTGHLTLPFLVANSLVQGTALAFNMPSRQAFVRNLVGDAHLLNAIGLTSAGQNVSRIAGPALAGALLAGVGATWLFVGITITYAVAAFLLLFIRRRESTPRVGLPPSLLSDMREGFRYVRGRVVLLSLLVLGGVAPLLGMPYQSLMPAFTREALGGGARELGLLLTLAGVGALVGSLAISLTPRLPRKGLALLLATLFWGVALLAFTLSRGMVGAGVLLLLVGFWSAISFALANALLQLETAPQMQGRVMSLWMTTFGFQPLGVLPISALAERTGTPMALTVGAVLLVGLGGLGLVRFRSVRRLP
ncbi:MAG: MFS transporter [Dehalococcoidia bacterium]